MATLKCIACGADNKVGDQWCGTCSSSLNLKLCSACEAINGHAAAKCHSCGVEFGTEVPAPEAPAPAADAPRTQPRHAEATVEVSIADDTPEPRSLPMRRYELAPRRGSRVAQAAILWSVAIILGVGAAYAYHHYQVSGWPAVSGLISAKVAPAPVPRVAAAPEPKAETAPPAGPAAKAAPVSAKAAKAPVAQASPAPSVAPAAAPAPEPKPKAAPVAPKMAKAAPPQAPPAPEATRAVAPVTHTRGGSAPVEPSASPRPPITAATVAPAAAVVPAASVAAPARVTHTRAPEPGEAAAVAVSAPAEAAQPPIEKPMNPNPSACAPGVAALGLCISK